MEQISAIIWLKYKLLINSTRTTAGLFNIIARVLSVIAITGMSIGMAFGAVLMMIAAAQSAELTMIRIGYYFLFYALFFISVLGPLITSSGNRSFEPARLLIFPISRQRLYEISLASGCSNAEQVFYYPTLLAVFITGIAVYHFNPVLCLLILLSAVLFNIVWNNTLMLILQSILKKRKLRELVIIFSFMIFMALTALPLFEEKFRVMMNHENNPVLYTLSQSLRTFGKNLPPSLMAEGFYQLHQGAMLPVFLNVFMLCLWISAGIALGYFVFINYHLSERGKIMSRTKIIPMDKHSMGINEIIAIDTIALAVLPVEVVAIVSKELKYYFRSVVGKFNIFMMPLFVIIISLAFMRKELNSWMGIDTKELILYGIILYAGMFSSNNFTNIFGWDGNGIKYFFLSPVPHEYIILGKNIALWLYSIILYLVCIGTWMVLVEIPGLKTFLNSMLIYFISIMTYTLQGNILSILFPVKNDISTIKNSHSQTAALLSMAALMVNALMIGACCTVPVLLKLQFLQPLLLCMIVIMQIMIYIIALPRTARFLYQRRELIIEGIISRS